MHRFTCNRRTTRRRDTRSGEVSRNMVDSACQASHAERSSSVRCRGHRQHRLPHGRCHWRTPCDAECPIACKFKCNYVASPPDHSIGRKEEAMSASARSHHLALLLVIGLVAAAVPANAGETPWDEGNL